MHVNAKKIALLGVLVAVSTILVILSGILEFNTLFLIALASFGVGIAIREYKLGMGIGYTIASTVLAFLLAPNKLYCFTYLAMCIYLVLAEVIFLIIIKMNISHRFHILYLVSKYVIFNIIYIPMLFLSPKLIYAGNIDSKIIIILLIGGQIALYIYDTACNYFQNKIWGKYRNRIMND